MEEEITVTVTETDTWEDQEFPVIRDDERLVLYNDRSGTLHIASLDPGRWDEPAVCKSGGRYWEPAYIPIESLHDDGIERNGQTATLCTNCQQSLDQTPEEWHCEECLAPDLHVTTRASIGTYTATCNACGAHEEGYFRNGRYIR